jgi:hypothetical protein
MSIPTRTIPTQPWARIWVTTVLLVIACGVALELFVRSRGYEPSLKDDNYAWAWQRRRVYGPKHVAILGGSRILLAFDADEFRRAAPGYEPVMLAVNGSHPLAALRDLAADPGFHGIALVDMSERAFGAALADAQREEVETYHHRFRAPGAMAERWLSTKVQTNVAIVSAAGLRALGGLVADGAWPPPRYVVTHADRTRYADFRLASVEKMKRAEKLAAVVPSTDAEIAHTLAEALHEESNVDAIQARGGRVIYVRMPTCGARYDVDEQLFPKARWWDVLAQQTHAVAIHFKDYPTLSDYDCPDLSHIDSKDAARFTRSLVDVLVARGVIQR